MPSKEVYALVEDVFEYNGDDVLFSTEGHHVRNIFVNKRDAEEALKQLTRDRLTDLDFSQYCYDIEELLPGDQTPESFCAAANKRFGPKASFSPDNLIEDLNTAVSRLDEDEACELINMLDFSFGKIIKTELHSPSDMV